MSDQLKRRRGTKQRGRVDGSGRTGDPFLRAGHLRLSLDSSLKNEHIYRSQMLSRGDWRVRHRTTSPLWLSARLPPSLTLPFSFSHRISSDKEFVGSWRLELAALSSPSLYLHFSQHDTSRLRRTESRRKKKPTQSVSQSVRPSGCLSVWCG